MMKLGKCRHYNGTVNDCCKAGVNYKELVGAEQGWGNRLPCHTNDYKGTDGKPLFPDAGDKVACDKISLPTIEEAAADEAKMKARFDLLCKARAAIVEHLGGPWKKGMVSSGGEIDCPCCGVTDAKLRFSRAGYNGHIHAGCTSPNCVRWME